MRQLENNMQIEGLSRDIKINHLVDCSRKSGGVFDTVSEYIKTQYHVAVSSTVKTLKAGLGEIILEKNFVCQVCKEPIRVKVTQTTILKNAFEVLGKRKVFLFGLYRKIKTALFISTMVGGLLGFVIGVFNNPPGSEFKIYLLSGVLGFFAALVIWVIWFAIECNTAKRAIIYLENPNGFVERFILANCKVETDCLNIITRFTLSSKDKVHFMELDGIAQSVYFTSVDNFILRDALVF